jgi:NAD-dependent dihydropyrimidine dehydrogenase PreA subunit
MSDSIFRELQKRLDQYSMGFPATDSGIEIKILEKLFSVSDAEIFLQMSPKLEAPEAIAPRIGMKPEEASATLSDMAERGLLFSLKKDGTVRYGTIPFVHGLFEFQIKRMDRELATLVRQYMDDKFKDTLTFSASNFLRVVPVQRSVNQRTPVAPYEDAIQILKKAGQIVIADCACRKSNTAIDQGCGKPLEVCFMFGSMGQYYLDHDMGRKIDMDEAARILANAHAHGLVTQPATSQNPGGMCNCCGDCCGPLTALKHHPKPAEMVFSNYFAQVDEDLCTGCETCLERCQMDALSMDENMLTHVDLDRCIGCGLCVTTCPTEAIRLEQKGEGDYQVPPENTFEQMMNMAKNRGII